MAGALSAQDQSLSYSEEIEHFREEYKQDHLKSERSPIKEADLKDLRFYPPAEKFQVAASFERTKGEEPFDLPTYSGITKPFVKYGILKFELDGQPYQLAVYQSLRTIRMPQYRNSLFLPFRDLTNDDTTYGGGRYIDLTIQEVEGEAFILDFNRCYNPWCCYSDGFNCPIPPTENHLDVAIEAGEKMFAGEKKH